MAIVTNRNPYLNSLPVTHPVLLLPQLLQLRANVVPAECRRRTAVLAFLPSLMLLVRSLDPSQARHPLKGFPPILSIFICCIIFYSSRGRNWHCFLCVRRVNALKARDLHIYIISTKTKTKCTIQHINLQVHNVHIYVQKAVPNKKREQNTAWVVNLARKP